MNAMTPLVKASVLFHGLIKDLLHENQPASIRPMIFIMDEHTYRC